MMVVCFCMQIKFEKPFLEWPCNFSDPKVSKNGITKDMFDDCMVPCKIPCSPPAPTLPPPARRFAISSDSDNSSEEILNPFQAVMGRIDRAPKKKRKFTIVNTPAPRPETQLSVADQDSPQSKQDRICFTTVNTKIKECDWLKTAILSSKSFAAIVKLEEPLASALEALHGREQKVVQGGWTFTKKRFDFEINASRVVFKLIRAVQVFEQKRSSNQITAALVGHLVEEFKEF